MDIFANTKQICAEAGIKPARSKGQNFLIDEKVYDCIIETADLTKEDIVLEVGPGLGFLTGKLAEKAGQVLAIELDDRIYAYLNTVLTMESLGNVRLYNQDILKFDFSELEKGYKLVANLPYNITSFFLRTVYGSGNPPKTMVLLLQKEVAERICAKAPDMSMLSVSVQYFAKTEIINNVKNNCFWPEPKVDSAVIKLTSKQNTVFTDPEPFFSLVRAGFSAKRKQLKNNLHKHTNISQSDIGSMLEKIGLDSRARAQELSLEKWMELFGIINNFVL